MKILLVAQVSMMKLKIHWVDATCLAEATLKLTLLLKCVLSSRRNLQEGTTVKIFILVLLLVFL